MTAATAAEPNGRWAYGCQRCEGRVESGTRAQRKACLTGHTALPQNVPRGYGDGAHGTRARKPLLAGWHRARRRAVVEGSKGVAYRGRERPALRAESALGHLDLSLRRSEPPRELRSEAGPQHLRGKVDRRDALS